MRKVLAPSQKQSFPLSPGSLINLDCVCSKMGVIPKNKNNATYIIIEPQVDKCTNQNDTL